MFLTLYIYISFIAFVLFSIEKFLQYSRFPLHSRWELYPVPKEGSRFHYGGSYYEEVNWWEKPRKVSRFRVIMEMMKEMLFIKRLFVNQRPFWWLSYCFHLGIYLSVIFTVLLLAAVILGSFDGANGLWVNKITYYAGALAGLLGLLGMFLLAFGTGGLLLKRSTDFVLRRYTTPQEYFNLFLLFSAAVTGLLAWGESPGFEANLESVKLLLAFSPVKISGLMILHILLLGFLLIYIPLSKMSHYVGKYFSFHRVLWDNEPNLRNSKIEQKVKEFLSYRPANLWAAPHVSGDWTEEVEK